MKTPNYETIDITESGKEVWKAIPFFRGKYEASTFGRIRNSSNKRIKCQVYDGRYLKFGYEVNIDGEIKKGWYRVHRAIAETFIPNPENKKTVNHKDGNRFNNSADNLEWATPKEQSIHARDVLHANCGENSYNAKHTNEEIKEIRRLYEKENKTIREIATMYNEEYRNIYRYVKYERWKVT